MNRSSLQHRIRRGLGFVFLSTAGSRLLAFAADVGLMRLLAVEVFGVMAFGLLVVNTLNLVRSMGIGEALIFREEADRESCDTGFYMALFWGGVLYGAVWIGAVWIALLAGTGQRELVVEVVRALGALVLLQALGSVPNALLERALAFEKKFWVDSLPTLVYALVALGLALGGMGVWSLVWARLVAVLASTCAAWWLAGWRPGGQFSWSRAREVGRYGRFVTGAALVSFLVVNIDDALVVRLTGVEGLGFYARAYLLANLPVTAVAQIAGRVAFPAYARMRERGEDVEELFSRLVKGVLLIALPSACGLLLLADPFTRVFFGERWMPIVELLPWLGIYGLLRAGLSNSGPLFNALGAPEAILKVNILQLGLLAVALYPLVLWMGAEGACIGVLLGTLLSAPLALGYVKRIGGIGPGRLLEIIRPLILPAVLMVCGMGGLRVGWEMSGMESHVGELLVVAGGGMGIYIAVLLLWRRSLLVDVKGLIREG